MKLNAASEKSYVALKRGDGLKNSKIEYAAMGLIDKFLKLEKPEHCPMESL